jgi:Leucine-rich repeat (LRR) protein
LNFFCIKAIANIPQNSIQLKTKLEKCGREKYWLVGKNIDLVNIDWISLKFIDFSYLTFLAILVSTRAAVELECKYNVGWNDTDYVCNVTFGIVEWDDKINITGVHLAEMGDDNVNTVNISDAILNVIRNEFFVKFKNLKRLVARDIFLGSIELSNCHNLEHLDVSGNKLFKLATDSIGVCTNLEEIIANDNRISYLEKGLLMKFSKLRRLVLSNNGEFLSLSLQTASVHPIYVDFAGSKINRIVGHLNSTARFSRLEIGSYSNRVDSIDPRFLYDFSGQIDQLVIY